MLDKRGNKDKPLKMTGIEKVDRRTDILILLFFFAREVEGVTKTQKLIFLLQEKTEFFKEYLNRLDDDIAFEFKPYKMGPFSQEVYEELEFLINLGIIRDAGNISDINNSYEYDSFNWDSGSEGLGYKKFEITEKGEKIGEDLASAIEDEYKAELEDFADEYNKMSLRALLEYVYNNYPETTKESEIKDDVLG